MDQILGRIFEHGRTCRAWKNKPVDNELITQIYDLAKLGPTSANCCPLRIVFVESAIAKEKLKPALNPANLDKTMSAPLTAIFAYDPNFQNRMDILYPPAKDWFADPKVREYVGLVNGTLQAAYFMLAARALGLDCGAMAGFNQEMVNNLFLKEEGFKSIFLCNLGYGDRSAMPPRDPRLTFDQVCTVI